MILVAPLFSLIICLAFSFFFSSSDLFSSNFKIIFFSSLESWIVSAIYSLSIKLASGYLPILGPNKRKFPFAAASKMLCSFPEYPPPIKAISL